MNPDRECWDLFIAHADNPADTTSAERLYDELRFRHQRRVFIDTRCILLGDAWDERIAHAQRGARVSVVLLSSHIHHAYYTRDEIAAAVDMSRQEGHFHRVVPVYLHGRPADPGEIPLGLHRLRGLDLQPGHEGVVADVLEELLSQLDGEGAPLSPPRPRYPNAKTQTLSERLAATRAELKQQVLSQAPAETLARTRERVKSLQRELRDGGLKAGDVLSERFTLIEPIGQGGFAKVWKAYDETQSMLVAVKVLHAQFAEDKTRRDRFFRGSREMARLGHHHIVLVLEKQLRDGVFHYFVMEHLGRGDLQRTVKAHRLGRDAVLQVIQEVGSALHFAHQRGVIHRDVKPANIMLREDGSACLTDFDLVRVDDSTAGTRTGMMGTFAYASPEALEDASRLDRRADIYSLGMTCLFGLYGDDLPRKELLRNREGLVHNLPVSNTLKECLKKAIALEPPDRYTTVAEFCEALAELRRDPLWNLGVVEEISPPPEPASPPAEEWSPSLDDSSAGEGDNSADEGGLDPLPTASSSEGAEGVDSTLSEFVVRQLPPPEVERVEKVLVKSTLPLPESSEKTGVSSAEVYVPSTVGGMPVDISSAVGDRHSGPPTFQVMALLLTVVGLLILGVVSWPWVARMLTPSPEVDPTPFSANPLRVDLPGATASPTPDPGPTPRRKPPRITPSLRDTPPPPTPVPPPEIQWALIPGGNYQPGGGTTPRTVPLIDFEMSVSEVTVKEYRACVEAGVCKPPRTHTEERGCNWGHPDRDDHPINCVSWEQAHLFATWVEAQLPTEDQWGYVVGVHNTRRFPWGDKSPTCGEAVINQREGGCGELSTAPVCSKPLGNSPQGVCDLIGNVAEWMGSSFEARPPGEGRPGVPSVQRVLRGGSWNSPPAGLREWGRVWAGAGEQHPEFGFRLVRAAQF